MMAYALKPLLKYCGRLNSDYLIYEDVNAGDYLLVEPDDLAYDPCTIYTVLTGIAISSYTFSLLKGLLT